MTKRANAVRNDADALDTALSEDALAAVVVRLALRDMLALAACSCTLRRVVRRHGFRSITHLRLCAVHPPETCGDCGGGGAVECTSEGSPLQVVSALPLRALQWLRVHGSQATFSPAPAVSPLLSTPLSRLAALHLHLSAPAEAGGALPVFGGVLELVAGTARTLQCLTLQATNFVLSAAWVAGLPPLAALTHLSLGPVERLPSAPELTRVLVHMHALASLTIRRDDSTVPRHIALRERWEWGNEDDGGWNSDDDEADEHLLFGETLQDAIVDSMVELTELCVHGAWLDLHALVQQNNALRSLSWSDSRLSLGAAANEYAEWVGHETPRGGGDAFPLTSLHLGREGHRMLRPCALEGLSILCPDLEQLRLEGLCLRVPAVHRPPHRVPKAACDAHELLAGFRVFPLLKRLELMVLWEGHTLCRDPLALAACGAYLSTAIVALLVESRMEALRVELCAPPRAMRCVRALADQISTQVRLRLRNRSEVQFACHAFPVRA